MNLVEVRGKFTAIRRNRDDPVVDRCNREVAMSGSVERRPASGGSIRTLVVDRRPVHGGDRRLARSGFPLASVDDRLKFLADLERDQRIGWPPVAVNPLPGERPTLRSAGCLSSYHELR